MEEKKNFTLADGPEMKKSFKHCEERSSGFTAGKCQNVADITILNCQNNN
jgi:hypothetical protein